MADQTHEEIKAVIEKAYIQGIHDEQDEDLIRDGFHEDFRMLVLGDNAIDPVSVDAWLERLKDMKRDNPELWSAEATHEFKLIDVSGYAAVAVLDVWRGDIHFSTDYMLLYKFDEGWQIVSKIFSIPEG
jgi:hypothetical protein